MRILLVDDEQDIVTELGSFLRRRGHEVVGADGVAAARRALDDDGPFDLVLTDMRMPEGGGLEVVRACHRRPAPRPSSLVMSGHADAEEIAQARQEGALDFFPKPVAMRELLKVLAGIEAARAGDRDQPLQGTPPIRIGV